MSLSDLLYPGNPEKREKVIRRSQELIELMKRNFRATNNLIEIVNEHLHSSFSPITLNENATVKENCDVMIKRVNQILAKLKEVDEKLKKKLEPTVYESLQHMSLKDFNKISAAAKVAIKSVCQLSAAVIVKYLMTNIRILTSITSTCAKVAVGLCATIVFGVLLEVIISGIVGYVERAKLETALAEYGEALAVFRPASEEYEMAIYEVMFMLKYTKK